MLTSIMKSLNGGGRNEMMNLYTQRMASMSMNFQNILSFY